MKISITSLIVLSSAALLAAEPFEIGDALSEKSFWETSLVDFDNAHRKHGFSATGEDSTDSCLDGAVTCFGLPVYETRIAFAEGKEMARVELMLYAKAGTEKYIVERDKDGMWKKFNRRRLEKSMTRADFGGIISTVRSRLTEKGAKAPQVESKRLDANTRQSVQAWPRTALPTMATLTWNFSQTGSKTETFKPGFVRLAVDGPAALAQMKTSSAVKVAKAAHGAKSIVENVVRVKDSSGGRGEKGDVFIDNVPMVDQGSKGYCAAASSERVLRYYGLDIDEHEIAQAAGTTAEGGTSGKAMRDSILAVGKRYKLATVVAYGDMDKSTSERVKNLFKEAEAYNKMAKKLKRREIPKDVYVHGHAVDAAAFDAAMEPEVRMELKCRGTQKGRYKRFLADIHQQVNKGIPLFWGVTLGIFPEPDIPQASGGHMRLIIGYNDSKNEILYTDSWGKGHELKRMSADQAFTVSHSLMYLKPLR